MTTPPQSTPNNALIAFDHISKRFGGVAALSDVSFGIAAGEIHALVGENGAGKSTLMKCLCGVHRPDGDGHILLDGAPIQPSSPAAARALGIDVVFQEIELAPNLTVAQSIFLAREPLRFGLLDHARMRSEAAEALERVGLWVSPDAYIETLRTAEKQCVQIARALAQGTTRVLIMDEPTSSLSDHEIARLLELLEALRAQGTTILYVSHKLPEIFRLADTITVLRDGRYIATRLKSELDEAALIALMAGPARGGDPALSGQVDTPEQRREHARRAEALTGAPVAFAARGLSRAGEFSDVSFELHRGEVLGIFGIVGAGRTELARAIFGLDPLQSGELTLDGNPVIITNATQAIAAGIALVPEDRKLQGLLLQESLRRNISLPAMREVAPGGIVSARREYALAGGAVRQFAIAARGGICQEAGSLSGGNQQKVVLAKWLATHPRLLILDEPTKGIDVGAKREVHALIREFAGEGLAVIVISSELDEVMAVCDRILVMRAGRITAEVSAENATRELLLKHAVT